MNAKDRWFFPILFLIIIFFILILPYQSYADKVYKIQLPELLGQHSSIDQPFGITVSTGKQFVSVKDVSLILKGEAYSSEWVVTPIGTEILSVPGKFQVFVYDAPSTLCRPRFTITPYPTADIGPLDGSFETENKFIFPSVTKKPNWAFLEDSEAIFILRFHWFCITQHGFKQIKPCIVDIKEAYLLINAESHVSPPFKTPPAEVPTAQILFESSHVNFAWGYVLRGFFIDGDGKIWKYDHSCQPWDSKENKDGEIPEENLREKFHYSKLVDKVSPKVLAEKISLIKLASRGKKISTHGGNDMGASCEVAYQLNESSRIYKSVLLNCTGDVNIKNTSNEVVELTRWLKDIGQQIREK